MNRYFTLSFLILLISDLVPLAGVLIGGWDIFLLLLIYWFETAAIGFWMATKKLWTATGGVARTKLLMKMGFFTFHAGIFMSVHLLFLWSLFAGAWKAQVHGPDDFMRLVVVQSGWWITAAFIFVFHGIRTLLALRMRVASAAAERGRSDLSSFYLRIVVMHVTILAGAFLANALGETTPLLILVALKIAVDISLEPARPAPQISGSSA